MREDSPFIDWRGIHDDFKERAGRNVVVYALLWLLFFPITTIMLTWALFLVVSDPELRRGVQEDKRS